MGGVPLLQFVVLVMSGVWLSMCIIVSVRVLVVQVYSLGIDGFCYWTVVEVLCRIVVFWVIAGARGWHCDVGVSIPVRLDLAFQ